MTTYRISIKVFSYSKKKGSYEKTICIEKGIETFEKAEVRVKEIYPDAKSVITGVYRTSGMLGDTKIYIRKNN